MTQGANLDTQILSMSRRAKLYNMLDAIVAVNPGTWVKDPGLDSGTLELFKAGTGNVTSFTAKLRGSNSVDVPTDSGVQIGADISALGLVTVSTKCRWYKLEVTALTIEAATSLNARLHCHTFKS